MGNEQRLRYRIAELQKQWELLNEQLSRLERDKILETRSDERFRLEQRIAASTTEKQGIERQLSDLETQLSEEQSTVRFPTSQAPQFGPVVYKMCNRDDQENDFLKFFTPKLKKCPRQPHFYFLHGEDGECHESFIERIEKTRIKHYVEQECGQHYAGVYSKTIPWPTRGDLETRQEDLTWNFIKAFEPMEATPAKLANALGQTMAFRKHPVVIIVHNMDAAKWDQRNEQFILWYIGGCWGKLECQADMPQFLIFLNVIYPRTRHIKLAQRLLPWKYYPKKRIGKQLGCLHAASGEPDPCQLIEELRAVTRADVREWFSQYGRAYGIYRDESAWEQELDAIFQENGQPVNCKSMADVERHLKAIVETYTQERLEL